MKKLFIFYILYFLFSPIGAHAQCGIENIAFKSGEFLSYDLYFNWKFVWVKVGTASMSTVQSRYNGQKTWSRSISERGHEKVTAIMWTSCGTPIRTTTVI